MALIDPHGRTIDYMRVSVTDRCNFRCVYCMPDEGAPIAPRHDLLTDDELARLVRVAAGLGVRRVRLTGGEPLVRPGLVSLVQRVASTPGVEEVSLTTNGHLLASHAGDLAAAGLTRVNVSLDTLDPVRFRAIARRGDLGTVLEGIEAALAVGLAPVKLNMVVMRGVNDDEVPAFARLTLDRPLNVRFIELMPIRWSAGDAEPALADHAAPAGRNGANVTFFSADARGMRDLTHLRLPATGEGMLDGARMRSMFISSAASRARIEEAIGPLQPAQVRTNGPARTYRLVAAQGTVGFISQVTNDHCLECNRFRLTADGFLRPCLMADGEVDVRTPLRTGATDTDLADVFRGMIAGKPKTHHLADGVAPVGRNMSQLGG